MRRVGSFLFVLLLVLGMAAAVPASEGLAVPVVVSPGSASGAAVGGTCPTFSWGSVAGATAYELVIYRGGDDVAQLDPLVRRRVAGTANSWTPSLRDCLGRGGPSR